MREGSPETGKKNETIKIIIKKGSSETSKQVIKTTFKYNNQKGVPRKKSYKRPTIVSEHTMQSMYSVTTTIVPSMQSCARTEFNAQC